MNHETVYVAHERLKRFVRDTFVALGVPAGDAEICSDVLIAADLYGIDTHGINRLKYYCDRIQAGVTRPMATSRVVKETGTTAVVDAGHRLGHVVAVEGMNRAMEKARAHGLGAVAVRNSTHFGIAGYYARMAAQADMIGLVTSNARPSTAPTHGVEPRYGTNPLAFGAPSDEAFPFLYDASMTVAQRGKLEVLQRQQTDAPEGWVVDEQGRPLTDTDAILARLVEGGAAFLPLGGAGERFGGHKGYGLSILLEILSAALQTGSYLTALAGGDKEGTWQPYGLGHFFLAIDIAHFVPVESFEKTVGDMMRQLRDAKKAAGQDRIWTAGEKEAETAAARARHGIPIPSPLQTELQHIQAALGVRPHLPFTMPGTA